MISKKRIEEEKKDEIDESKQDKEIKVIDKLKGETENSIEEEEKIIDGKRDESKKEEGSTSNVPRVTKAAKNVKTSSAIGTNESTESVEVGRPNMLKLQKDVIAERERMYNDSVNSGKLTVSYQNESTLKIDVREFSVLSDFEIVTELTPYIVYSNMPSRFVHNTIYPTEHYLELILKESIDMFKYGTTAVKKILNREFFGKQGVNIFENSASDDKMLEPTGLISGSKDQTDFLSGILACLSLIVNDKRVLQIGETICDLTYNSYGIGGDKVIKPVKPSAFLAAVKPNDLPWFQSEILDSINSGVFDYKLGKTKTINDNVFGLKKLDTYATNIDMYAAQLLNLNLFALADSDRTINHVADQLKCHSVKLCELDVAPVGDIRPDERFDGDHILRCLVLLSIMYPKLSDLLLSINTNYIRDSGFITMVHEVDLYYPDQKLKNSSFTKFMTRRIERSNDAMIHEMLALEMTPINTIRMLANTPSVTECHHCAFMITEFLLYCWILPNTFDQIKGDVQNRLIDYFRIMFASETLTFLSNYGTTYTITDTGFVFSKDDRPWTQSTDLLNGKHPSLFSGQDFTGCPRISELMKFFTPLGELIEDDMAMVAKFPRLSRRPTHYIPYKLRTSFDEGQMTTRFRAYAIFMKQIVKKIGTENSMTKSEITPVNEWFNFMIPKIKTWEVSLSCHLRHLYATMANFMLNYNSTFNGDFSTNEITNYCLKTTNGVIKPLMLFKGKTSDGLSEVRTNDIWSMLGSGQTPLMKRAGEGIERVPIEVQCSLPEPEPSYTESLNIARRLKQLVIPQAITTLILSKEYMADNETLVRLRGMLPKSGFPDSMVRKMAKRISDILSIELDDYGKMMMQYLGDMYMHYRLNDPEIRRVDFNEKIYPFDDTIDPEAFRNPTCFLTNLQISRLEIGLKMLVDSGIIQMHRGIRLTKFSPAVREPDFKPPVLNSGFIEVEYSNTLFKIVQIGNQNINVLVHPVNHTLIAEPNDWPKLYVKVKSRSDIRPRNISEIIKGIEYAGWAVDVLDVVYTAEIIGADTFINQRDTVETVLAGHTGEVNNFTFIDGIHEYRTQSAEMPLRGLSYQYIYPLGQITGMVSARGLTAPDDGKPEGAFSPSGEEYDTGSMNDAKQLVYTDGTNKLEGSHISMTNVVALFSDNVIFNSKIHYTLDQPTSLVDDVDVGQYPQ